MVLRVNFSYNIPAEYIAFVRTVEIPKIVGAGTISESAADALTDEGKLSLDSTGDTVLAMSQKLNELGYLTKKQVGSTYTKNVADAVRKFEEDYDFMPDGELSSAEQEVLLAATVKSRLKAPVVKAKANKDAKTVDRTVSSTVTLTWKEVKDAAVYTVKRSTSQKGEYTFIGTTDETSFTDEEPPAGKVYYTVSAGSDEMLKGTSTPVSATVPESYTEPIFAAAITKAKIKQARYEMELYPTITNTSKTKTVDSCQFYMIGFDAYQGLIVAQSYGNYYTAQGFGSTDTIKPGKKWEKKGTYWTFDDDYALMTSAYFIVTRCHTTDGVTADREDELRDMIARYASGEVDFETLEGVYIWNKEE